MVRVYEQFSAYVTPRRVIAGLVLVALAVGALILLRFTGAAISPAAVRALLAQLGVWGPLALIAVLAGVLVVPVIPASIFQIGAGLAFGPVAGLVYVVAADILGSSIGFGLARRWGQALLDRYLSPESRLKLAQLARRIDWRGVVILRLIPGPAYPLVSFAAGYSPMSYLQFILSSLGGVFPGLALLVIAGDMAQDSPFLAIGIVVLVVAGLAVAGRLIGKSQTTPPQ